MNNNSVSPAEDKGGTTDEERLKSFLILLVHTLSKANKWIIATAIIELFSGIYFLMYTRLPLRFSIPIIICSLILFKAAAEISRCRGFYSPAQIKKVLHTIGIFFLATLVIMLIDIIEYYAFNRIPCMVHLNHIFNLHTYFF